MFSKKDLKILESIIMLCDVKRNSGKRLAAKRLNVSIDTLNKYLDNLEEELGVKLVLINNRHCGLTIYGEKIVKIAEQIRECLQKVYKETLIKDINREIKIAHDRNIYAPKLQQIYKVYPHISFCFDAFEMLPDMSDLSYDICLSCTIPKGEDLAVIYKKEVSCGYFVSKKYLQKNSCPQNFDDLLKNHNLIIKKDMWSQINDGKKQMKQKAKIRFMSNSLPIVKEAIIQGGGIGILPLLLNRQEEELVWLKDISCDVKECLYLLSPKTVKDVPCIRQVLEYYKKIMQDLN